MRQISWLVSETERISPMSTYSIWFGKIFVSSLLFTTIFLDLRMISGEDEDREPGWEAGEEEEERNSDDTDEDMVS